MNEKRFKSLELAMMIHLSHFESIELEIKGFLVNSFNEKMCTSYFIQV